MKMKDLVSEEVMKWVPISFHFFKPIEKKNVVFSDKHIRIKRYQSTQALVEPPQKPISRLF